ncbi:MAG: hypothetical protein OHK0013_32130 [Sandaracinaceae bacterium]
MTHEEMDKVADRILEDASFCDRMLSDPQRAVGELGVGLTDEEVAIVKGMSRGELEAFAREHRAAADPSKRRAAC